MLTIAAKPTKYRGIQYASRLEATWAVFWGTLEPLSKAINRVEYIGDCPSLFDPLGIEELRGYSPDFRIICNLIDGSEIDILQEVKPILPNEEYMAKLRAAQGGLSKALYHVPLLLTFGSFREGDIEVLTYPYGKLTTNFVDWLVCYGAGPDKLKTALDTAKNFRWDLYRDTGCAEHD